LRAFVDGAHDILVCDQCFNSLKSLTGKKWQNLEQSQKQCIIRFQELNLKITVSNGENVHICRDEFNQEKTTAPFDTLKIRMHAQRKKN
jgi:hypothetical protein